MIFQPDAASEIATELLTSHIKYKLLKVKPPFQTKPAKLHYLDCSAFVRYFLYHATGGKEIIDGKKARGTYYQEQWCDGQFVSVDYSDAMNADGVFRLAFLPAHKVKGHMQYGHVWLVHNRMSLECHGGKTGHSGPDRRRWDHPHFDAVNACYVLGNCIQFSALPSSIDPPTAANKV